LPAPPTGCPFPWSFSQQKVSRSWAIISGSGWDARAATGGSRRYGQYIRLEERRLKLGQYLFLKHGGKVVFFGRFVAVLRAWAAFLAGTNRMRWPRFLLFNATGGIVWATLYGLGGYFLGDNIHRLTGPIGPITLMLAVLLMLAGIVIMRSHEQRLADEAERALPGSLDP